MLRVQKYLSDVMSVGHQIRLQHYDDLCSAVLSVKVPSRIRAEITAAAGPFLATAPAGLAVRSSSVFEDSEKASFAGVFDSYLCISTHEELLKSVQKCWCASWSPAAVNYSKKMSNKLDPDHMAVLIQEIVPAQCAGILFTANPMTGNPWELVLYSNYGLAQSLVDGTSPADETVLAWNSGQILRQELAEKSAKQLAAQDGVREVAVPEGERKIASVSESLITVIWKMGLRLDRVLDLRLDIEWAVADGTIFLVQARPLTALPVFFPHDASELADKESMRLQKGYICAEIDGNVVAPLFRNQWGSEQWLRYNARWGDQHLGYSSYRDTNINARRYSTESKWIPSTNSPEKLEQRLDDIESTLRAAWTTAKVMMKSAGSRARLAIDETITAQELIPHLLKMRNEQSDTQAVIFGPAQTMQFHCEALLGMFLTEYSLETTVDSLLQGVLSYSTERAIAAYTLGAAIDEGAVLQIFRTKPIDGIIDTLVTKHKDCEFLLEFERFCWSYGLLPPSWLQRPDRWARGEITNISQIIAVVRSAVLGQGRSPGLARIEAMGRRTNLEREMRKNVAVYGTKAIERFEKLLRWAQFWSPVLDDRTWSLLPYFSLFELAWETGDRLARGGLINSPEDVLFFRDEDLTQIASADSFRGCIGLYVQRKHEHEMNRRLAPPEWLGTPPPSSVGDTEAACRDETSRLKQADGELFSGTGLTPGEVTGRIRKSGDISDPRLLDSLTDEHILVGWGGIHTNTDWYSLLMVVVGIIIDEKISYFKHAHQVSREFGVPLITMSRQTIDRIPEDALVYLNGTKGTVSVVTDAAEDTR
jgi:rifampicin phosphotransferase